MANPYHHALSSAKRYGGTWRDYIPIHEWFDETKGWLPDFRHRAIRHHSEGIAEVVKLFEPVRIKTDKGDKLIPVRFIAEQHVMEDLRKIPTAADWLRLLKPEGWMTREAVKLSKILEEEEGMMTK